MLEIVVIVVVVVVVVVRRRLLRLLSTATGAERTDEAALGAETLPELGAAGRAGGFFWRAARSEAWVRSSFCSRAAISAGEAC